MDKYKVFTLGQKFPLAEVRGLVSELHSKHQHYIVMVDPGEFSKHSLVEMQLTHSSCRCSRLWSLQSGRQGQRFHEDERRHTLER